MIWKILGIEKTKDKDLIRKSYLKKLKNVNPEDDQEGFKELRGAYEKALEYCDEPDEDDREENDPSKTKLPQNDIDKWILKVEEIYSDMGLRRDVSKWKAVLNDPICDDLDMEMEASEKLLIFLMTHSYLPQEVWQLIDKRFDYLDNIKALKEHFPENYLDYVAWQINNQGFLAYEYFDGNLKDRPDEYINKLFELKGAEDRGETERLTKLIEELESFEIRHPFLEVEKACYLLLKAGELKELSGNLGSDKEESADVDSDNSIELRKQALNIMEELDFEYSANIYIHRIYGEALLANRKTAEAKRAFEEISQNDEGVVNYSALLGIAKCLVVEGDYENAKEQVEDILEEKVQDVDSLSLLDIINSYLVDKYNEQLKTDNSIENIIKLGWCYYQQREFEKGIKLLDDVAENDEYDYVNLRCRLYLANDDYDKAYPWAVKWLGLIKNSIEDGSKEMSKRKNRLSLANFSIGVCLFEMKNGNKDEAVEYIDRSIAQEKNRLVKLSYMEQLAKFYLAEKKYEKCIDKCNEIINEDAGFFPAFVHRQRANYELKNAKEVVDDYYACTELYAEYAPPYILAAEVFFAFEQYDDIEEILERAKEVNIVSDMLELYRIRVLHYKDFNAENLGKCLEAIEKLSDKITNENENTDIEKPEEVVREHVIIYWDLDKNERALEILNKYLKYHPDVFSLQNLKVDILNQTGKYEEALKLCRQLYEDNKTVYMQTRLGICYEKNGDYKNALFCYKGAYDRDPDYQVVVRRLMFLYSYLSNKENDLEKCRLGIRYATEYIRLNETSEGYVERGNLYIDLYELEKAVVDCEKAISLNEGEYYAYNNLGCALLKLRRIDEAIPPLVHAIEMDPKKDHLPYLNLAECYVVKGEFEKAIEQYKTMISRFSNCGRYNENVAKLYCRLKRFSEATVYYDEQIKNTLEKINGYSLLDKLKKDKTLAASKEKLLELYCDLGDVYRQAGDHDMAESYYNKVVKWWKKTIEPDISVNSLVKAAEYYRDRGNLSKASSTIELAWKKMSSNEIHSRVRRNYDFASMTISFEMGNERRAEIKSRIYMEEVTGSLGSIDKLLKDERYRAMWLFNIGVASLCAGNIRDAESYFEQIRQCRLCVMCESEDCFEYYFAMGLIAEKRKEYEKAEKLYEKAIELRGDYPAAERHLGIVRAARTGKEG